METTKVCNQCDKNKSLKQFYKNKSKKDGYENVCKECTKYNVKKYKRTRIGLITSIYNHQKNNSIKRGHELPLYSREELIEYVLNDDNFENMFKEWKLSNYSKIKTPSIDRIRNDKGYMFSNIKLVTWNENDTNYKDDLKLGINNSICKKVDMFCIDSNKKIKTFNSITIASKETGISKGDIWSICNNKRNKKRTKNYYWRYTNE